MNEIQRLAKLKAEQDSRRKQIIAIEERQERERASKLIGLCFRYRNCYSCPSAPSDYWWLYVRVLSVSRDGRMQVFRFQIDKDGKLEIEPRTSAAAVFFTGDGPYQKITRGVFDREWRKVCALVARQNKTSAR